MSALKIENLQELLSDHLGGDKRLVDAQISRLTGPGENFGSLILKVDIKLKDEKTNCEEKLYGVAKLIPEHEFFRNMFNVQVTFKNEVAFYNVIVPTLREFQMEQGLVDVINIFPAFYAARANLKENSEVVDGNGVLMLENLKESGYTNINRYVGSDLETAKIILRDLSLFHAVPLALKQKKPEMFQTRIQPYCAQFRKPPPEEEEKPSALLALLEIVEESEDSAPFLDKVRVGLEWPPPPPPEEEHHPSSPFSTICHCDMWINNVMVKFEYGKPIKSKLVDFQEFAQNSLAEDLFFFLFTSVMTSVLREHLDELIEYYHECLMKNLKDLNADTTLLSLDSLLKEIQKISKKEFRHILFMMLFVIMSNNGLVIENGTKEPDFRAVVKNSSPAAKMRACFVVAECGRRGWI